MKKFFGIFILIGLFLIFVSESNAATRSSGYLKKNGTYVSPYYRSTPDSSKFNNYSTKGNYNPYTGKTGYTSPYKSYSYPSYKSYTAPSYNSYKAPSYKSYSSPSYKSYSYPSYKFKY